MYYMLYLQKLSSNHQPKLRYLIILMIFFLNKSVPAKFKCKPSAGAYKLGSGLLLCKNSYINYNIAYSFFCTTYSTRY